MAETKRKRVVTQRGGPEQAPYAEHLRNEGYSMSKIVRKSGFTRSTLYRDPPPRLVETRIAEDVPGASNTHLQ